ncbi:class I SAM-dependent methyltransferase [Nocardia sp. NPDC004711]
MIIMRISKVASSTSEKDISAPTAARIRAGAEHYNRSELAVYDRMVLGTVSRWIWRCPRTRMLAHYDTNIAGRHLDIGPGTGWFLDNCKLPPNPSITLLDLNDVVLDTAARRIERYHPTICQSNVFEPLDLYPAAQFDSVGMNFLLHCLPGSVRQKSVVFDHVIPHLAPGARVFGSTILGESAEHTPWSRALMRYLNREKVFGNRCDSIESISHELNARFAEVHIRQSGVVCLFSARDPH